MVQRDYAVRGKKSKKKNNPVNKTLLILLALILIIGFSTALFLLKEGANSAQTTLPVITTPSPTTQESTLPSRPEEMWSYIRDLETREIPIENGSSTQHEVQNLTEEQKQILKMLENNQTPTELPIVERKSSNAESAKPATPEKSDQSKTIVEAKPVESKNDTTTKTSTKEGRFGLQCGAFKNRQQAENLQAKLVISGFDARTEDGAKWVRVFIGPVGNRNEAKSLLEKVNSVANCIVTAM